LKPSSVNDSAPIWTLPALPLALLSLLQASEQRNMDWYETSPHVGLCWQLLACEVACRRHRTVWRVGATCCSLQAQVTHSRAAHTKRHCIRCLQVRYRWPMGTGCWAYAMLAVVVHVASMCWPPNHA
jgi:hypothetical protein